jgi:excisionase family DNA binding protein
MHKLEERRKRRDAVDGVLSISEVADWLFVSEDTVVRKIESGQLEAIIIHRGKRKTTYRIARQALEKFVRDNSTKRRKAYIANSQFLEPENAGPDF